MWLKVLIEMYGGVVQRVAADKRVDIYLLDFDTLDQGASLERRTEPVV